MITLGTWIVNCIMYFYLYVSIGVQYSYTTEKRWWDGHEQEMTVEGGVMAGVSTKGKCKMSANSREEL